jgi:hypothetical protein
MAETSVVRRVRVMRVKVLVETMLEDRSALV